MFDRETSERLTALLIYRILNHANYVRHATATGIPRKRKQAIDQAAAASAEVSTLARIIGVLDLFNAGLASVGLPAVPALSAEAQADAQAMIDEARANDEALTRIRNLLTNHLN